MIPLFCSSFFQNSLLITFNFEVTKTINQITLPDSDTTSSLD